jgi:hypothetical protein
MAPELRKRLGEFLILLIFVLVDAFGLWPQSHFWALLTGVAGIVVLLLLDGALSLVRVSVAAVVLSAIAAATYWIVGPAVAPNVEVAGSLHPDHEPTPPNACDRQSQQTLPPDTLRVLIGGAAFAQTRPGKFIVLQVGSCNVLSMERTPDGVNVDAELYDAGGKLIATIANGQTHVMTGENVRTVISGDLSKMTVTDGAGEELLSVHYLNPTTITAGGIFACPGHPPVPINSRQIGNAIFPKPGGCFKDNVIAVGIQ